MLLWIIVAVIAAIGEVLSTGLFLATAVVAALITAVLAVFVPIAAVQVLVFGALSLLGILAIRPIVVQKLGMDTMVHKSGELRQSHLVGRRGIVTQTVDAYGGQIRVGQGEFWSARSYGLEGEIPVDTPVEIVLVDGLKALVTPIEWEESLKPPTITQLENKGEAS